jgi:uncharacterized cupredoxin-like copper-binding protein
MVRSFRLLVCALALGGPLTVGIGHSILKPALAHEGAADDDDFAAGEPGDAKKPFRVLQVTTTEKDGGMIYSPSEIDVTKGEQIKFIISNVGTLKHEFHLASVKENASHRLEMQKNPEMEHDDPNAQTVEPGKQAEILWRFSKAGEFEFACLIPGHYEAGMHGKIVVK